jgi:hypothetical protein
VYQLCGRGYFSAFEPLLDDKWHNWQAAEGFRPSVAVKIYESSKIPPLAV